ncbi:MAG: hypothetical protein A2Y77_10890 [Planctomycetes bacterium RBG_13_62_9]|nr:MAG: hypothetical protein A2Y77_10890 [Planctomycetes bacterium RBG_13_62_9]
MFLMGLVHPARPLQQDGPRHVTRKDRGRKIFLGQGKFCLSLFTMYDVCFVIWADAGCRDSGNNRGKSAIDNKS